jgi:hypothetical protein
VWQIQETRAARPEQQTVRSKLGVSREFLAFV